VHGLTRKKELARVEVGNAVSETNTHCVPPNKPGTLPERDLETLQVSGSYC
jgi:hypothetical protein